MLHLGLEESLGGECWLSLWEILHAKIYNASVALQIDFAPLPSIVLGLSVTTTSALSQHRSLPGLLNSFLTGLSVSILIFCIYF